MKAKLFFLALCASLSAMAQQVVNFEYCKPKELKLIVAKSLGVNIRQAPSKTAPTLYFGCAPETDDCSYMWSNKLNRRYSPQKESLNNTVPTCVLGEEGEFYKIKYGNVFDQFDCYVAKSVTTPVEVSPVTMKDLRDYPYSYCAFEEGPYKGLVIGIFSDDLEGEDYLKLGVIENGAILYTRSVSARFCFDETTRKFSITTGEDDKLLINFGPSKSKADESWLDPAKLTVAEATEMLTKLGLQDKPNSLEILVKDADGMINTAFLGKPDDMPVTHVTKKFELAGMQPVVGTNGSEEVLDVAEQMPQFPGGTQGLISYLSKSLIYPPYAQENKIEGRVIVEFIVNKQGQVGQAKVIKSIHPLLDQEAVRVVMKMPNWTPGMSKGKPVSCRYKLPISFKLTSPNK